MDAAVFTLFSNLIKNWQDSRRFSYLQAYKMYEKFPVGSVTTRVSAKAYEHFGDIARVDPHFARVLKVASQKTHLLRGFLLTHGKMKKTMRENVLMIVGGGLKKSFLLKRFKKIITNSMDDPDSLGILEILKLVGLCRKVPRKEDICPEDEEDSPVYVEADNLFWMQFNSRNTFEGLMDIAASSYTDGPKVSIICDELSLCVNGCGLKLPGCILLDEYIFF